ncbi:MAG: glycosyltransferase, partial [Allobaculum sp.]|nr:glycosyltransferase [Allobaculum sp.]
MSDQTRSNELDLDENQAVQDLLGAAQNEAIEALDKDSVPSKKADEGQSLVEEEETEEKVQEVEIELEEALNEVEDLSEESTEEEKPRLSVVIAAYNGGPFIEEQLDSIYNQTLAVDELLIRDDGSKDNTVKVVQGWIEKHPDFNAHLIVGEENL